MRDYKFRGYSKGLRVNKWFYGSLIKHTRDWYQIYDGICTVNVHPESVGQMILKFQDGSEFYEGDIVEFRGDRLLLEWDYYFCRFQAKSLTITSKGVSQLFSICSINEYRFIGTNYENPEQIEQRIKDLDWRVDSD